MMLWDTMYSILFILTTSGIAIIFYRAYIASRDDKSGLSDTS